jgi:anaerobic magnesium-protoporphyrin IX monomethyl ester cyclase
VAIYLVRISSLRRFKDISASKTIEEKEVLLVFPGKYQSPNPQVPLALLHLASPLLKKEYKVRIIDMRLEDYRDLHIDNPFFVGISTMSGHQIRHALDYAKKVRDQAPDCPIIWGGVHPTLLPKQTAQNSYVDIVVRGEGEETVVELADALYTNKTIDNVKGITYKQNGKIISTPDREFIDLNNLATSLPYHLLSKERYPSLQAGRIHIQTSRGCPHRCSFCYNSIFNRSIWRGTKPEWVLEAIESISREFPNLKVIDIVDDNFFVDKHRVAEICKGMIKRIFGNSWRANCRFDYLATYKSEFISLLENSHCTELNFGAETGSAKLLTVIKKDVTIDQMVLALQKLQNWAPSIDPYVFWMSGYPGETKEDLNATFEVMNNLNKANEKTQHIEMHIFTPFPSPMLDIMRPQFVPPQSLEEWGNFDIFHFKPPWHTKEHVKMLENISMVTRYAFYPKERIREMCPYYKLGFRLLNKAAQFRWRHKYFRFATELRMISAIIKELKDTNKSFLHIYS